MKRVLASALFFLWGFSAQAAEPLSLLKESFQTEETQRISVIITKSDAEKLSRKSRSPISAGVVRAYKVKKDGKTVGGAVLLIRRVRTKDMASLYIIEEPGQIKNIEILAFYEPPEYEPSGKWLKQFRGKNLQQSLAIGSDLTNITGATLSAEEVSRGARFAIALYEMKKEEFR